MHDYFPRDHSTLRGIEPRYLVNKIKSAEHLVLPAPDYRSSRNAMVGIPNIQPVSLLVVLDSTSRPANSLVIRRGK